jgi:hypothetical protein
LEISKFERKVAKNGNPKMHNKKKTGKQTQLKLFYYTLHRHHRYNVEVNKINQKNFINFKFLQGNVQKVRMVEKLLIHHRRHA